MNGRCNARSYAALSVLCWIVAPSLIWAQASTGTISGVVTDQQGAVIAGTDVSLTDLATNSKRTTSSNDVGRYIFLDLPPGQYSLSMAKPGFKQVIVAAQAVEVGVVLTLNVTLEVGAASTSVQVQAAAGSELQTDNATVGTTITGPALMNLPNLGRDANTFYLLQPTVNPNGNIAGAQTDQNMFQLDGGNNSSDQDGTYAGYTQSSGQIIAGTGGNPSGVIPTPAESVEEFKVSSNNQTADFNGATGGQIQMVTKRGANHFHGSAYEYYFGGNWGANNWLNNHTPSHALGLPYTPLPSTHQNRFGGTLGGPLTPSFWGGRTYFFVNYEARRFPNVTTIDRLVPTALMRAGVIQVQNSSGQWLPYNLNPNPVTVNGTTYQPAMCPGGSCDPRGIGLNPILGQIWNKYMPLPNDPSAGDGHNTQGYLTTLPLPLTSNFAVARIDHDFGSKWRFMGSYRYYRLDQVTNNEVDIGGALPGDTLGLASSKTQKPQTPSYLVAGLTGVITPNLINDFRFSYLRNAWQWISAGAPAQLSSLGVAVEPFADSSSALIPFPVDRGDALSRFWDGQDKAIRDDLSLTHGNHLFQFGGSYQRNFDKHQRNDNGVNILSWPVDQINSGPGIAFPTAYLPATVPTNQISTFEQLYATVTGIVSQSQVFYARTNGVLQPVPSNIESQTVIPSYGLYFGDTWHIRPTITLIYGLGYQLEMPPHEIHGNLPMIVDSAAEPITGEDYMAQRQAAALQGQVYNPTVGFATAPYVGGGQKYPFPPFYGGFSPRAAIAWAPAHSGDGILGKLFPSTKTVIRAGYGRTYARLNGINMVQVPLQGTGVGQPVSCIGVSSTGQCLGTGGVDPSTAYRIGIDGNSAPIPSVPQIMPEPLYPGVNGNAEAGISWVIDHKLKPAHSDQVDFTLQRAITQQTRIEVGYVGQRTRNLQIAYSLDSVPYMTTLGGQSFAQAFANLYMAMSSNQTPPPQAFLEAALGGSGSSYCSGFSSCTAAVASKQKTTILTTQVYNLWSALNVAPGWTLGRTMPSSPGAGTMANPAAQASGIPMATSNGWSNYNAGFMSLVMGDWHGITATSNLTWSHSLGTGVALDTGIPSALDQWNLGATYGPQPYDLKLVYNLLMLYQPPVFKSQRGILGHVLGGWRFAPLFTARSGFPLMVNISGGPSTNCQSFGESNCATISSLENAPATQPYTAGNSAHYNVSSTGVAGSSGNLSNGGSGINMFANPTSVYSGFRRLVLGYDSSGGGAGTLRAFPTWNLDFSAMKEVRIREQMGITLSFQLANVLNHFQPGNPALNIDSPSTWGVVNSQANTPRQIEVGARLFF